MKQFLTILLFVVGFTMTSFAQVSKVNWTTSSEKISDDTYKIILTADVEDNWYIYSQNINDDGPVPTNFIFKGDGISTVGETSEDGEIRKEFFDTVFDLDIVKYGGKVQFTQVVNTNGNKNLSVFVTFMSCDDERCLPPKRIELPVQL